MKYVKYHGCGNDAIVFDAELDPRVERVLSGAGAGEFVRWVCERRFGIGADVVIEFAAGAVANTGVDARMRVFNSDGSSAEMCSTGVRAIAKYLVEHRKRSGASAEGGEVFRVKTGRGVLEVHARLEERGMRGGGRMVRSAKIGMGEPVFEAARVPVMVGDRAGRVIDAPMPEDVWEACRGWREAAGLERVWSCASMGNPHVVMWCKDVSLVELDGVGGTLERHGAFPARANVHFVQVLSRSELKIRHWERGAGITLACGTGASATVAIGVVSGRTERCCRVRVPGGVFEIEWKDPADRASAQQGLSASGQVMLDGPIEEVGTGEVSDDRVGSLISASGGGHGQSRWDEPGEICELRTPRLVLRGLRMSDGPELARMCGREEIAATTATIPHPYSLADAEWFMRGLAPAIAGGTDLVYGVTLATDEGKAGVLVGTIGLMISLNHRRAEMGYWVDVEHWNKGYASEAAKALMQHAFEVLELERVYALHYDHNPASGRVMERAGMVYEGRLRGHILKWGQRRDAIQYGLTRAMWKAQLGVEIEA